MADQAGKADGAGPAGEVGELPTVPPAPRRDKAALRWATPGPAPAPGRVPAAAYDRAPPGLPRPVRSLPHRCWSLPVHPDGARPPGPGRRGQAGPDLDAGAGTGGGGHRRLFALLVLAGALCALAGAALVIVWRVGQDKVAGTSPPVSSVPSSPLPAGFAGLLGTEATAARLVQGGLDHACRPVTPQSGARALLVAEVGRGADLYHQVLVGVKADQVALARMPEGRARSAEAVRAAGLARSAESSGRAAGAYAAWLEDLQATGCYSAPTNDIHYREATAAARAAGRAGPPQRENPPGAP